MDKKELSEALSKKLNKNITVKEIILVGSGYHSDGFKILTEQGQTFFIKKVKSEDLGFEFTERKIMSLLVSHSMLKRHNIHPNSVGVAIHNQTIEFLPEISDKTEIYHIQEYGGEGESYLKMLADKSSKKEIDSVDKKEIDKVIDFIVSIHKIKHPSKDKNKLTAVYNDCLRNVIGHPEYLLQLLQGMPEDSPMLKPGQQSEYMSLMLENMHYFKNKPERLVALHGDFWGANVFFRKDGSIFVIDYSRMPWGDAGFDIGFWTSVYLISYHRGNSEYYKQLGEYFLNSYISKTNDKEVIKTMVYSLGLVAAMYASSKWVPGIDDKHRISFVNHVMKMLREKKFSWEYKE